MSGLAGVKAGATPDIDDTFLHMDKDGDGWVSKAEAGAFFDMMSQMAKGMGEQMPDGGSKVRDQPSKPTKPTKPQAAAAADDDDDDELPSHDEL